jgi:hypothetical protein
MIERHPPLCLILFALRCSCQLVFVCHNSCCRGKQRDADVTTTRPHKIVDPFYRRPFAEFGPGEWQLKIAATTRTDETLDARLTIRLSSRSCTKPGLSFRHPQAAMHEQVHHLGAEQRGHPRLRAPTRHASGGPRPYPGGQSPGPVPGIALEAPSMTPSRFIASFRLSQHHPGT